MAEANLVKRSVLLSPDEDRAIDDLWHGERRRSRSEMLRVLAREALRARGVALKDEPVDQADRSPASERR